MSSFISSAYLDEIPGENCLKSILQKNILIILGTKTIKTGKLILYKKAHYNLQLTLLNSKQNQEKVEIPIPFNAEYHKAETDNRCLIYFDYRLRTLSGNDPVVETILREYKIKKIVPNQYYNKILQIEVL